MSGLTRAATSTLWESWCSSSSGRLPFSAETPMATILQHLNAPPPLDGKAAAGLPSSLRPVLRRALAKSPDDRYSTAAEMAAALRGAPHEARRRTAPGPTGRLERRRRRAWTTAAGLGGLGLALAWFLGSPDPRPSEPTFLSREPEATIPASDRPPLETVAAPTAPTPSPRDEPPARPAVRDSGPRRPAPAFLPPKVEERITRFEAPAAAEAPPSTETTSAPDVPVPAPQGWLQLLIIPWAEVSVDDRHIGTTPMRAVALPVGRRTVLLSHPDYGLVQREVVIDEGQTTQLEIDLRTASDR